MTTTPSLATGWRSVALPSEHGGWSLTLEPALLGLFVAWSGPGLALAAAALLAFVARTPIKVVLVDRWRDRWLDRTDLAARVASVEIVLLVALVAVAAVDGDRRMWIPIAIAAPLVAVELWYDMRSRSRRLIPELAGTVGIGSIAAAIVLADGGTMTVAIGLWVVIAARAVASIPLVRTQVLRTKGNTPRPRSSDIAQAVAVVITAGGWALGLVPAVAVVTIGALAMFGWATVRLTPQRVVVIGAQQVVLGLTVVVVTALAVGWQSVML